MARLAVGVVLLGALAGCAAGLNDEVVPRVDAPAVSARLDAGDTGLILDVRPAEVYREGHIPGARNLRLGEATDPGVLASLRGQRVVVYGQHPGSAAAMAMTKRLLSEGLNASLFEGGFEAWRSTGFPVDRGGGV